MGLEELEPTSIDWAGKGNVEIRVVTTTKIPDLIMRMVGRVEIR